MITKAQVKHIRSLEDKNYRKESNSFLVEGDKMVKEALLSQIKVQEIFAIESWLKIHHSLLPQDVKVYEVSNSELERLSLLKTPNSVLASMALPMMEKPKTEGRYILLDTIQDPGNMGSIIRIADWFNLDGVTLYGACTDPFSPKCVQSSMGSILRVSIGDVTLEDLQHRYANVSIIGASLDGKALRQSESWKNGFIAIGNESKGISDEIKSICTSLLKIEGGGKAESLNAAVAAGIICHALL